MKPAIKKLKTCTYSKDLAPSAAVFGQREQHTNKLVCDHPEMKLNWSEKVCGPCTAYENRNAELVVPVPQPPQPVRESPAKAASPAPVRPVPPVVTPPPVSSAPAIPAQAKPANKPAVAKPAAVPPPAKSAAKPPEKKASATPKTQSQGLSQTDSQSHAGKSSEIRQEDCYEAEEEVTIGDNRVLLSSLRQQYVIPAKRSASRNPVRPQG